MKRIGQALAQMRGIFCLITSYHCLVVCDRHIPPTFWLCKVQQHPPELNFGRWGRVGKGANFSPLSLLDKARYIFFYSFYPLQFSQESLNTNKIKKKTLGGSLVIPNPLYSICGSHSQVHSPITHPTHHTSLIPRHSFQM